jgi:hypothetical protein
MKLCGQSTTLWAKMGEKSFETKFIVDREQVGGEKRVVCFCVYGLVDPQESERDIYTATRARVLTFLMVVLAVLPVQMALL